MDAGVTAGSGAAGVVAVSRLAAFSRMTAAAAASVVTTSSVTTPVTSTKHKIVSNGGGALQWVSHEHLALIVEVDGRDLIYNTIYLAK